MGGPWASTEAQRLRDALSLWQVPTEVEAFATELFDGLPARYDALAEVLSFGQNRRWRAELVRHIEAPSGGLVLDVATGPGGVAVALRRGTGAAIVGLDLTYEMLRMASKRFGEGSGVHLVQASGTRLPFPDCSFDAVSFTYLLRYVSDPAQALTELVRVLRPGGTIASLEFAVPGGPLRWPVWWVYTRLLLPACGSALGGREWWRVGRFLGPNISRHYRRYPVQWQLRAWTAAGLDQVQHRIMSQGGGVVMWARKHGGAV